MHDKGIQLSIWIPRSFNHIILQLIGSRMEPSSLHPQLAGQTWKKWLKWQPTMLLRRVRRMICCKLLPCIKTVFFLFMRWKVVMDSLGQMKKLSKWAIFENQDGLLATSVLHDFCLWNQLQVIHRCYASEAPSSTMGQLGLGCSKRIGVAVFETSPGGGWLESSQITTCVPFLQIEPWHFWIDLEIDWGCAIDSYSIDTSTFYWPSCTTLARRVLDQSCCGKA